MFLFDDLILAPVKGVMWLAEQVQKENNRQLFDASLIKARLAELQQLYDSGLISEAEFCRTEETLLVRLNAAQPQEQEGKKVSG
jgi:cytochrome c-type biogenesis protein CcmH/NrfG